MADYGIDAPKVMRRMLRRGITLVILGIALWFMNRESNPQGGAALCSVAVAIGLSLIAVAGFMHWSSRTGKLAKRDELLDALPWRGDEKVLDVGCGRGLMLIGAAKRTKSKVTGVDIWSAEDLTGNTAEAAMANAKEEGVAERVKIENADARRLPYQPASFDTVVSSLAIHNIPDANERTKALDEMLRVTKPGGHIGVFDIMHTGDYERHFAQAGTEIVRKSGLILLWCIPGRWIVARKKAA